MTTAREIMTEDVHCVRTDQTLTEAAQMMRELGVGALPVCGDDDRLAAMVSDRDSVCSASARPVDDHGRPARRGQAGDHRRRGGATRRPRPGRPPVAARAQRVR